MSAKNLGYEAWEERMICQEKGKRIVQYYLKSTSGRSLLAVVGTERSLRHMAYVVSNEFLEAYGSNTSINRSLKWGARRDVVSWLISLVRNDGPPSTKSSMYYCRKILRNSLLNFYICQCCM